MRHILLFITLLFLLPGPSCMARVMEHGEESGKGPQPVQTVQEIGPGPSASRTEGKKYRAGEILVKFAEGTDPQPGPSASRTEGKKYRAGEILVKFREGTDPQAIETVQKEARLTTIQIVVRPSLYLMKITDGSSVEEVMARLQGFEEVEYAEPNYIHTID